MNDAAREEIKARLPLEDLIGRYVELKRVGRTLKGRSPWGIDKTPSFMVSPEKGIWHDFSANKGGDIFTFLMEVEGITFREALEKLSAEAGVELSRYGNDRALSRKKSRLRECLEWACKYYQVCLVRNRSVCEYAFYKRNLNRATIAEFRIGYAPDSKNALTNFLAKKGYSTQELQDAGLLNRFGRDLFRNRLMIPFIDPSGHIIGFTARVLDKSEPKYLNTPDTILFNKSRFIFGLYEAKEAIRRQNFIVIVEGNMDVISSHQAGVKTAVATSGTAMTELHLKALARLSPDIRLAYDGDDAGVRAAERAIMLAGQLRINLSVISDYAGAKDPDELIQRRAADSTNPVGHELWQQAVTHSTPAIDWLLRKYEDRLDLTSGQGKRAYSDVAVKLLSFIPDSIERSHYEQLIARRLQVSVSDLRAKKIDTRPLRLKKPKTTGTPAPALQNIENSLLAIALYGGPAGAHISLDLPEDEAKLAELELIFNARYGTWSPADLTKEATNLLSRYQSELTRQKISNLSAQLDDPTLDEEHQRAVLREITTLRKEQGK